MESKYWMFTLNNPTEPINQEIDDLQYLTYQVEIGEQGTLHYQGYIEFKKKLKMNGVKKRLGDKYHLEPRRGSQEQAIAYCQKQETRVPGVDIIIIGTPTIDQSGKRNDLEKIKDLIKTGKSDLEIAEENFGVWCKFNKSFKIFRSLITPKRNWKTYVTLLVGPPGCGKSKHCLEATNKDTQYWKQRSQWWDEYEGQGTVIIDDYYGWLPWDVLLRICDRYPLLVETKGGQAQFTATQLYITSNQAPELWYKNVPNFKAFIRRIDKVIFWTSGGLKVESQDYESIKHLL